MGTEKTARLIRNRIIWIAFGVLTFYILGVFVRSAYGIRLDVTNRSGAAIHDVSLGFVRFDQKEEILVGEIAPGKTKRLFFRPGMKSSYYVNFTDAQGVRHTGQGETYVPADDSADVKITVLPSGNVEMDLPTHHLVSWESWCGFL